MAIHETLTSLFIDIANAIRNKTGKTDTIVANNFSSEIDGIETNFDYFNDKITSVREYSYYGMNIKSAFLPYVISIGDYAFAECANLENITILSTEISIGENAFPDNENFILCGIAGSSLEAYANEHNITFVACEQWDISATEADNVMATYNSTQKTLKIYGDGNMKDWSNTSSAPWYSNKENIKNITLSDNVTNIGSYAFSYCSSLTSISIPDSVTSIGERAFSYCSSLTSISIPDSVTSISSWAFLYCESLTRVNITDIAAWCKISFNVNFSNPLSCAKKLYLNGTLMTELAIPDSVTSIGDYAFQYCESLASVNIPDSVTSIGWHAFYHCTNLTNINIPDSVTSIGNYAFDNCSSLTRVDITDLEAWCNIEFSGSSSNPLYCAENLYLNGTLVTDLTIPDSVTSIGDYVFRNCTSLTSISIPDNVTSIGSYAFAYCTSLTNMEIPDSVTSIGSYAFAYCTSLTSVSIGNSVTSIGERAFNACTSLESIIYENTTRKWYGITKGRYWNTNVPATYVQCSDGQAAF